MFWHTKPTIDKNEEEWMLETWKWLLENLGGIEKLKELGTRIPSQSDFPRSGKKGQAHVEHVFKQVAEYLNLDPDSFKLVMQEDDVDPMLGPLAVVQNAPQNPLGTYSFTKQSEHLITISPAHAQDLTSLISTITHELCHPILLSIPTEPPGGAELEELATDLSMVFFGFGIFGANSAISFKQFQDTATGTQGWSFSGAGYMNLNQWGYALALRTILLDEDEILVSRYLTRDANAHYRKNLKYLRKSPDLITSVIPPD